jgi:hypothetical protein
MLCLMSPEARVPTTHPLRAIKKLADKALEDISPMFDAMYSSDGRPSIPLAHDLKFELGVGAHVTIVIPSKQPAL